MSQRWNGAVAVVTGASSGIGMQLCTDLRARGAQVVGVARRIQGGTTVSCDVADTDALRALLADVEAEHGRIDLLVNCAAVEERSWARDGDLDVHHRIMAVNYFAPVAGTLAVLPGMIRRRRGVVVNVSSDSARAPAPGTAAYAASKAALSAFSEAVAHEVRPFGVRVHVFYPGWVPTPMGTRAVEMGMPMPPR
ncbi:MAG: short-chain dehydrogenase, partial [Chloroflexota bacterium]